MNSGIQGVTDGQEEGARNVVYFHGYIEGRSPFSSSSSRGHLQPPPEVLTIALERGSCSLAEALHRDGLGDAFESSSSSSQGRSSSSCSCSDLSLRWPETWQTPKGGGLFGRQSGVGGLCLSLRNRLAIAQDVTAGINHAHSHGVLHRDLKPANVLLSKAGHVKLCDFGSAKQLSPGELSTRTTSPPSAFGNEAPMNDLFACDDR